MEIVFGAGPSMYCFHLLSIGDRIHPLHSKSENIGVEIWEMLFEA